MQYFDYETVAREAKIPPDKMAILLSVIEQEFPNDPMMCELHVLRACMAIRDGHLDIQDALKPRSASNAVNA